MDEAISAGETCLVYNPKFREYGLSVLDGGTSYILITFCPWCGTKLPQPLRDEWFDRLERMGLEPNDPQIPEDMQTDAWWKSLS